MVFGRPLEGVGLVSAGLLLVAAYSAVLAWAMNTQTYSVWGGLVVVPWVIALNAVLIWRAARRWNERWFTWVLALGYLAKLVGVAGRYFVAYVLYNGAADAERYNLYAAYQYSLWRQGYFVWEWDGKFGTKMLELITTAIYTITGPTPFGGFVVFGSLAFWGVYLMYVAFRTAVPHGDAKRYALLAFFLPSLLYWPASIGKEAWLLLFVGAAALGGARYFNGTAHWLAPLVIGGVGLAMVRPHVAVLLFASLLVAQLFRPADRTSLGILAKVGGLAVLAGAAWVLTTQSAGFLGIDDLNVQSVTEEIQWASGQTQQGGSAFTPVPLNNPLGVPSAIVTMLLRPFPWEGGNVQMLVQGLEGLFLLALTVFGIRRWNHLWHSMWRHPYLVFAFTYVMGYIIAFSQFGNFGIVARQRALMLPLFLVFLALPLPEARSQASGGATRAEGARVPARAG